MPDLIIAGIAAVTSIGSAYIASEGSQQAASTVAQSNQAAIQAQLEMFYANQAMLAPWTEAGAAALQQITQLLAAGPGEFEESPSYQFRLSEGLRAIENSAASKGKLLSGQTEKGLVGYAENLASQDYQNWLNNWYKSLDPYYSLATMGGSVGSGVGAMGTQTAANVGSNIVAAGEAIGGGQLGSANAWIQGLSGGSNTLLDYYMLQNMGLPVGGGGTTPPPNTLLPMPDSTAFGPRSRNTLATSYRRAA